MQYGRANIESAIKRKDSSSDCPSDTDEDEIEDHDKENSSLNPVIDNLEIPKKNGIIKKISSNGNILNGNGNSVISKESLILVPDKTITTNVNQTNGNGKESPDLLNNNDDEVIMTFTLNLALLPEFNGSKSNFLLHVV